MNLYVKKHPDAYNLSLCVMSESDVPPDGFELMTVEYYNSWCVAEIAAGWTAEPQLPPPPDIHTTLAAIYDDLPVMTQAAFAPLYFATRGFIDLGKLDVARARIAITDVPSDLAPLKQQMLDAFDAATAA